MNSLPKNVQALAARLAVARGTSVERAVELALQEALAARTDAASIEPATNRAELIRQLENISRRASRLPVLDPRSADEILGYDGNGVPS